VKTVREEEGASMKELSAQLAAAEEERRCAGWELEQMNQLLRESDGELRARLEEEQVARIEEESVRLKARFVEGGLTCV
jgi:hypothetical protein